MKFAKRAVVLAGMLLLWVSCTQDEDERALSASGDEIEQKTARGPIQVVLRVSPKEPTVADVIELEMEIATAGKPRV